MEASWLLEVGFYGFPFIAVTLDTNFVILGVQNLSFGRPGASILPPWGPSCQLEDTLGDHGSSRKDTWEPRTRFLVILNDFGIPVGLQNRPLEQPRSSKRPPASMSSVTLGVPGPLWARPGRALRVCRTLGPNTGVPTGCLLPKLAVGTMRFFENI